MLVAPPNEKFFQRSALSFVLAVTNSQTKSRRITKIITKNPGKIAKHHQPSRTISPSRSPRLRARKILFCWAAPVHESVFIGVLGGSLAVPPPNLTNLLMLVVPPKEKNCESTFSKTQTLAAEGSPKLWNSAPPREKSFSAFLSCFKSVFIRALSRRSQTKADIRGQSFLEVHIRASSVSIRGSVNRSNKDQHSSPTQ
jgi:hypothetical protein